MKRLSEAMLLEREKTRRETITAARELLVEMLHAPLIQMLLAVMIVEIGQQVRFDGKHQLITDTTGSAIEVLAVTAGALEAVGKAGNIIPKINIGG